MNNPQTIRHLNEIDALNALFRKGGMSRAELARTIGLNRSSTGNIVASLMSAGLVVEAPETTRPGDEKRTGRPGIEVRLSPDGAFVTGVEIGVDRLSAVVIDLSAAIVRQKSVPFDSSSVPPEVVIAKAAALAASVLPTVEESRLKGVCVTLPALLDHDGVARNAHVLGWRNTPVTGMFREFLPFPLDVTSENDANAFAIGEIYNGNFGWSNTSLFLNIENGVGGAIIVGGRLFRGAYGFAGEFGHLTIERNGRPTKRGTAGELETLIGKDTILGRYEEVGGQPDLDRFMAALARGDEPARRLAEAWADDLSYGLAQLVKVLDPDLVVLGGSVAPLYSFVAERVQENLDSMLIPGLPQPKVELSTLGPSGAAAGAACIVHQKFFTADE